MDVSLMEWDRRDPRKLVSKSRYVSIPDHRNYKYLIDCQGRGYSLRLKWLMATGRPVFLVEKTVKEHWELELEPWVHFIPVAADLSNLLEHHSTVESDPELYDFIARNSRSFAARRLTLEARLLDTAEAIRTAAEAFATTSSNR